MSIIAKLCAALSAHIEKVRTFNELMALSDHELADIGLTRGDIGAAAGRRRHDMQDVHVPNSYYSAEFYGRPA